ncbi:MAG: hypothetical protein M3O33_19605 [Cyanobacteriota bacterium]|nr:hypothetical protein [Cyanobacteriota bacterium]
MIERGRLGGLAEVTGADFIKTIADQLPEELLPGQPSKVKFGFQMLAEFELSYRGFVQHRIREHLDGESYMKNPKSANELLKRVKEQYANLLDLFSAEALRQKVAVVVTPVQTVGNVFFSYIEVINGKPHFFFSKNDHDAEYNPQDSEQPLKYLLRFLLKLHIQGQWGMFNFIRDWLGFDNELKEIVRDYAKDCKTNSGFEIIQGKDWLNI